MENKIHVPFVRLNNNNYNVWSLRMKMLLIKENLWKYVSGTEDEENEEKALKSLSSIILMIDNDQLSHVAESTNGKDAWNILQKFHQNRSVGHKIRLYKKLFKTELAVGGDMQKHLQVMFETVQSIKNLGDKLEDTIVVNAILASLSSEYENLVTALEGWKETELTLEAVKLKLLDEWERRNEKNSTSIHQELIQAFKIDVKKSN